MCRKWRRGGWGVWGGREKREGERREREMETHPERETRGEVQPTRPHAMPKHAVLTMASPTASPWQRPGRLRGGAGARSGARSAPALHPMLVPIGGSGTRSAPSVTTVCLSCAPTPALSRRIAGAVRLPALPVRGEPRGGVGACPQSADTRVVLQLRERARERDRGGKMGRKLQGQGMPTGMAHSRRIPPNAWRPSRYSPCVIH